MGLTVLAAAVRPVPRRPRWLPVAVAGLGLLGLLLATAAQHLAAPLEVPAWHLAAVFVLLLVSSGLGLDFRTRGHGDRLDLFEVGVAVALVALPGGAAVALVAVSKAVTLPLQGFPLGKAAFNVAQRACAAGAGALLLAALREPGPPRPSDLLALVPALAVAYVVNTLAVTAVLRRVAQAPVQALPAAVVNALANLGLGLAATALWLRDPLAWPALPVALVAAHLAARAWVQREAATARLVGLHRAAAVLNGPSDLDADVPRFLRELTDSFSCGGAELHLPDAHGRVRRWTTCGPVDAAGAALADALLADPGARRLPDPARPVLGRLLAEAGRCDGLVAPVGRPGAPDGVLLTFDRAGWAGFGTSELPVLQAVAGVLAEAVSREHLEGVLAAAEARWRTVVRHASDVVLVLDSDDRVADANAACSAVLGRSEQALRGSDLLEAVDLPDRPAVRALLREVRTGGPGEGRVEFRTDCGARYVEAVVARLDEGPRAQLVLTARDVTLRRRRERLVADQAHVIERVAAGAPLLDTLADLAVALERQVPGSSCGVLLEGPVPRLAGAEGLPEDARAELVELGSGVPPVSGAATQLALPVDGQGATLAAHGVRLLQVRPFTASDERGVLLLAHRSDAPPTATALVEGAVRIAALAAGHAAVQQRLAHQAAHDPLTDLPNRAVFLDRLGRALRGAEREGRQVLVLFLDLDRFKVVNDSLGHRAGDALLLSVADRLRQAVRPGDTVARFGGDEFTMLCERIEDDAHALRVVQRVQETLSRPFPLGDNEVFATASIGMALGPGGTRSPEVLVEQADAAMYRAKERGGNRFEAFDATMRDRALHRLDLQSALHRGLERGEFRVHYQPTCSLETGSVVGLEALVRWERAGRGLQLPGDFIDLAEESGLIVEIGAQVLDAALVQAAHWQADAARAGRPAPYVGVNLSARQLVDPGLTELLARALDRSSADPSGVVLELTESALIQDMVLSGSRLEELKALGVRLYVDDFGTGYSSLTYLQRLPVDGVKVDRSFVAELGEQSDATAIVRAVVGLAESLGLATVAEGVESSDQVRRLLDLHCTVAQGFHLGRPVPPEHVHLDARTISLP